MRLLCGGKCLYQVTLEEIGLQNECTVHLCSEDLGVEKVQSNRKFSFSLGDSQLCLCCGASATKVCDFCGLFCNDCSWQKHPDRVDHHSQVQCVSELRCSSLFNLAILSIMYHYRLTATHHTAYYAFFLILGDSM